MPLSHRVARRDINDNGVDMTPMLDIVFILLVFFIITASFISEEGITLEHPAGGAVCDCGPKPIGIYLFADGRASVDGQIIAIMHIPNRVQSIRADRPQAAVIIGADATAAHGNVVYLKDQFDLANIPVSLKINLRS